MTRTLIATPDPEPKRPGTPQFVLLNFPTTSTPTQALTYARGPTPNTTTNTTTIWRTC